MQVSEGLISNFAHSLLVSFICPIGTYWEISLLVNISWIEDKDSKVIESLGLESIYGQLLENLSKWETPVNVIVQKQLTVAAKKDLRGLQQVFSVQWIKLWRMAAVTNKQ